MRSETLCPTLVLVFTLSAFAQAKDSCTTLMDVEVPGVEITKAAHVEAGSTEPIPWNQSRSAALPAYCRVASTDTGHKSHGAGFDFGFMRDQQAYLDFAYLANAEVATLDMR